MSLETSRNLFPAPPLPASRTHCPLPIAPLAVTSTANDATSNESRNESRDPTKSFPRAARGGFPDPLPMAPFAVSSSSPFTPADRWHSFNRIGLPSERPRQTAQQAMNLEQRIPAMTHKPPRNLFPAPPSRSPGPIAHCAVCRVFHPALSHQPIARSIVSDCRLNG